MLVKDIILKACVFTSSDELASLVEKGSELNEEMQHLLGKFIKCFNLTRNEIESEYEPMLKERSSKQRQENFVFISQ